MPDRQPTCREIEVTNSLVAPIHTINCYWCFRIGWRGVISPEEDKCADAGVTQGSGTSLDRSTFYGHPCELYCDSYPNKNINMSKVGSHNIEAMKNEWYRRYVAEQAEEWKKSYIYSHSNSFETFPNLKVTEDGKNNGNYDIGKTTNINPKDWAVDSGQIYGPKIQRSEYNGVQNLEYGWNCDVSNDSWIGATGLLNSDNIMNETHIKHMDAPCKNKPEEKKYGVSNFQMVLVCIVFMCMLANISSIQDMQVGVMPGTVVPQLVEFMVAQLKMLNWDKIG